MDKQIYEKIIAKKEFSDLPKRDVEKVYGLFDKEHLIEEEKIKKTRDMLRKVYFAFGSLKLLNKNIIDKKGVDEILKKHISTLERFDFYNELYGMLLKDISSGTIIDLGAGINGLSYNFFGKSLDYVGIEAVGQLADLMNYHFKTKGIENAGAIHESLFELEKIKKLISQTSKPRVIFLFKTIDSLEMVERDYSKKLLKEIVPLVDRVIVSFATKSLISKKPFKVKRYWFENFVKETFNVLEDFELGNERYIVFEK
jgi:hypothetical protein